LGEERDIHRTTPKGNNTTPAPMMRKRVMIPSMSLGEIRDFSIMGSLREKRQKRQMG
jgi:hypothetical protein